MYAKGQKLVALIGPVGLTVTYNIQCPKKGEIVTCDGAGIAGIYLVEYASPHPFVDGRPDFISSNFRPIIGDSATSELTSSFKEVSEKSDLISVPEKEMA